MPRRRQWIAGLSAVGAANMSIISLRQLGVVQHLPDLPVRGFDSNAVMVSGPSEIFGFPDAPLAALSLAANVPFVLYGDRVRAQRWVPVAIAAKSVVEVSMAAWFLWQMKDRVRRWCAYCLVGASLATAIATLAVSDASAVLPTRRARRIGAFAAFAIAAATLVIATALDAARD